MKSRNRYELGLMRKSGAILAHALKRALGEIKEGISGLEIDEIAKREIYKLGGDLSYKTVPGYKFATCITVNDEVVHGIPKERKFLNGDLVSVDLAVLYKGWHTDSAWSILVGSDKDQLVDPENLKEKKRFLKAGEEALWEGIRQAVPGNRVGDISYAIQSKVEEKGYQIVRSLVGHGVGRSLHEDPEVPGFGRKDTGPLLKSGMTLAIEVIYAKGSSDVILDADGWTFKTADSSWGGLFEMTVVVEKNPEVLTDWRKV